MSWLANKIGQGGGLGQHPRRRLRRWPMTSRRAPTVARSSRAARAPAAARCSRPAGRPRQPVAPTRSRTSSVRSSAAAPAAPAGPAAAPATSWAASSADCSAAASAEPAGPPAACEVGTPRGGVRVRTRPLECFRVECGTFAAGRAAYCSLAEDELAGLAGVGLALHLLHDLTDERARGLHLAVADLGRDVGVGLDDLVDGRLEGAVVGHELEPAGIGDGGRAALTVEHALEHLTGHRVVEPAGDDQPVELGDARPGSGRRRGVVGQPLGLRVGAAGRLAQPPLAGRGCGVAPSATVCSMSSRAPALSTSRISRSL